MGVKFIKLDEESRDVIDQLVSARAGDISAFDEVEPVSETAPAGVPEPRPAQASKEGGTEGFFPKSTGNVPQPAPEDRTVMKQATELLQEALREVGNATASSPPAKQSETDKELIPRVPPRSASVPAREKKTPGPMPVAPKFEPKSMPAAPRQVPKGLDSSTPLAAGPQQRFEPVKPQSVPSATNNPSFESSPKTVPATPLAARRVAQAAPAPKDVDRAEDYKLTARASGGGGRGIRIGIILLAIGGAAAAVVALSRKPEPAPAPVPEPSVSTKVESAPVVIRLSNSAHDAAPEPNSAPPADASAAAAASVSAEPVEPAAPAASVEKKAELEKPAVAASPKVQVAPRVRQARHKKADAGAATAPASETASETETTPAPSKPRDDSAGSSESAPAAKSKSKTAAPAAPTTPDDPYGP
jgi:hypothetical protein